MSLNIVTEIDNRVAVKHVLMSVSDKSGLETFVPALGKGLNAHIAHIAGAKTVMLFTDYDCGRAAPKGKANVIVLHGAKIADIPVAAVVDSLEELCSRSTLSS